MKPEISLIEKSGSFALFRQGTLLAAAPRLNHKTP